MSHFPLVTVGITCYNDERFIRECMESVLSQTYTNLEIMVVDDHSYDGTADILKEYENRIRLIRHESNSGSLLQGRIDVIANATGDYVAHLDADDFWHPDFVKRIIAQFTSEPELDWVVGNTNIVNSAGFTTNRWNYDDYPTEYPKCIRRGFTTSSLPFPNNGIFKRAFLTENNLTWYRLPNTLQGEDAITSTKYLECRPRLKQIPDYLFNYRLHGANMSFNPEERVKMIIDLKKYYFDNFDAKLLFADSRLTELNHQSAEYRGLTNYLMAKDFLEIKKGMKIPAAFSNEDTEAMLLDSLHLFNEPIKEFARESLEYVDSFRNEIQGIIDGLEQTDIINSGRRQLILGNLQKAGELFTSAINSNGQTETALNGLGEVHYRNGDLIKAEEYIARAARANPNSAEVLNNAGVIFDAKNDLSKSIQAFISAIKQDPHSADAHLNLAAAVARASKRALVSADLKEQLIKSLKWLSNNYPDNSREQLLIENWQLAREVVDTYRNKFAGTGKKIMLQQPDNGALKYLMQSWRDILGHMGIETELLGWMESTRSQLNRFNPDILITVNDKTYLERIDMPCINEWRKYFGLRLGLVLSYDQLTSDADFLITFNRDPERITELEQAALPLLSLPFAANPLMHFMRPGREIWDYFFVGTNSAFKRTETEAFLSPVCDSYEGMLAGVNWTNGIGELAVEHSALFYSFARICPNYHVKRQMEEYNEVNERTFAIPACGGFEIVDNPRAIEGMFAPAEMAIAQSPEEYQDMFRYYLERTGERHKLVRNGMRRVFREYTLFHVLEKLVGFLGMEQSATSLNKTVDLQSKENLSELEVTQ